MAGCAGSGHAATPDVAGDDLIAVERRRHPVIVTFLAEEHHEGSFIVLLRKAAWVMCQMTPSPLLVLRVQRGAVAPSIPAAVELFVELDGPSDPSSSARLLKLPRRATYAAEAIEIDLFLGVVNSPGGRVTVKCATSASKCIIRPRGPPSFEVRSEVPLSGSITCAAMTGARRTVDRPTTVN